MPTPDELQQLIAQAEKLFEEEKYDDLIALLPDDLLNQLNDPELMGLRARSHRVKEENELFSYWAKRAIGTDATQLAHLLEQSSVVGWIEWILILQFSQHQIEKLRQVDIV